MKVLVLYRPNSELARQVEEFIHDLQTRHNVDERHLEILDYDSREGAATASLYDVTPRERLSTANVARRTGNCAVVDLDGISP
jgi:hypothetical protein